MNLSLGVNTSLVIILVNIPIFILGYKLINREFIFYSLIGMISLSVIFFGIDMAITTLVAMYVTSTTIKYLTDGLNYKRTEFIITNREQAVSEAINKEMMRGCTLIQGTGSYTNKRS